MNSKKIFIIVIMGIFLVYLFSGDKDSRTTSDNYGQYDKGTPLCDKGAYGDVNGLCK